MPYTFHERLWFFAVGVLCLEECCALAISWSASSLWFAIPIWGIFGGWLLVVGWLSVAAYLRCRDTTPPPSARTLPRLLTAAIGIAAAGLRLACWLVWWAVVTSGRDNPGDVIGVVFVFAGLFALKIPALQALLCSPDASAFGPSPTASWPWAAWTIVSVGLLVPTAIALHDLYP